MKLKTWPLLLGHDNIELGYMYAGRWQHIADTYAELALYLLIFSLQGFLYKPEPEQKDLRHLYIVIAVVLSVLWSVFGGGFCFIRLNEKSLMKVRWSRRSAIADMEERAQSTFYYRKFSGCYLDDGYCSTWQILPISAPLWVYIYAVLRWKEVMQQSPEELRRRVFRTSLHILSRCHPDPGSQVISSDTRRVTEKQRLISRIKMVTSSLPEVVTTLHTNAAGV